MLHSLHQETEELFLKVQQKSNINIIIKKTLKRNQEKINEVKWFRDNC